MADLIGKYDYSALTRELKGHGIKTFDLSAVLRQIAKENNIDDIKSLDGSQKITVSENFFEDAKTKNVTSPFDNQALFNFASADEETLTQKPLDENNLPEIYNDDEYEIADYEDYYNFSDKSDKKNENTDFETFKKDYAAKFTTGITDEKTKDEAIKKTFDILDVNSDTLLDKSELSGAFYTSLLNNQKDFTELNSMPQEGQDLLGQDMMNMDMQNDSFNPQG